MACLTITIDSDVLERAQLQAAVTGVPVKQVVRNALAQFAAGDRPHDQPETGLVSAAG